jgi:hypothetical protein
MAIQEDVLVLQEGGITRKRGGMRRADHRPGLNPALLKVLAHRLGVLVAANHPITVVVYLDQPWPPDDADGQVRGQADVDRRAQALRP